MNPELRGIWNHMRRLGLGALAHANRHAAYMSFESETWEQLSVLQAAHAAELLIKARIAQEHPLLIFDQLPKNGSTATSHLELDDLFKNGRTIQWSELPNRLWATTGIRLPNEAAFTSFGRLRNVIQHFAPPQNEDYSGLTLKFIFEVVDPFINHCWGLFAVDYDEDYEPYTYFTPSLINRGIRFLISEEAAKTFKHWDIDWDSVEPDYKEYIFSQLSNYPNLNIEPDSN